METGGQPTGKRAQKPDGRPTPEPAAESHADSAAEPATDSSAGPTAESASESATEPTADPALQRDDGDDGDDRGDGDSGGGHRGGDGDGDGDGDEEPATPHRGRRSTVALTVSVFGELLITAGIVLALFVVYSLWWTNVLADRDAKRESDKVRHGWAEGRGPGSLDTKDGIGFLHVPSMSEGDVLVRKGTDPKELNQGIAGYYTKPVKSGLPQDQSGNFALAAHRDGHGAKFHNINKIKKGDAVVFETKNTWYVYKVYETLPQTSKYNTDVLDAVPKESGKKEAGRYITLTTCTPVYTSRYRYIVWGELVRTEDVDAKRTPPAELR